MTVLDDEIGDLLAAFRADEAVLDDAARERIWQRLCTEVPDAPEALDAMAGAGVRRLGPRPRSGHRILAIAAALLVLLAVAGVALRQGPGRDGDTISAGPTEDTAVGPSLDELADEIAARPVVELGSTPEAAYAYLETRSTASAADNRSTVLTETRRWVARDGTGRVVVDDGDASTPAWDTTYDEPGSLSLDGPLSVEELLALPDDPDAVSAAYVAGAGSDLSDRDVVFLVLDDLAFQGLPAHTRAGMLRFLDRAGFVPVPAPDLGPGVLRVEGLGPGYIVRADIERSTGLVLSRTWRQPRGSDDVRHVLISDLRPDTQGE